MASEIAGTPVGAWGGNPGMGRLQADKIKPSVINPAKPKSVFLFRAVNITLLLVIHKIFQKGAFCFLISAFIISYPRRIFGKFRLPWQALWKFPRSRLFPITLLLKEPTFGHPQASIILSKTALPSSPFDNHFDLGGE
jgi:hypothetical protein